VGFTSAKRVGLEAIALVVGDVVKNSEKLYATRQSEITPNGISKQRKQEELTKVAKTMYLTMRAFPAAMIDVGVL
jgi:hypothetical protein